MEMLLVIKETILFSKKAFLTLLLFVSLLLTSSTFAYWADSVNGSEIQVTSSFVIGSPIYDNHLFVLDSTTNTYVYYIDVNMLLENPIDNRERINFGIVWNDALYSSIYDESNYANVVMSYQLYITSNGKEVNRNTYHRFGSLINIEESISNDIVFYNTSPLTTAIDVTLNPEANVNDYKLLIGYDIAVVIVFDTINE